MKILAMARLERLRAGFWAHKYSLLLSFVFTLLGCALYAHTYIAEGRTALAQFVDSIELKSYDARFQLRGQIGPSPKVVIVAIDQATLQRLGSWPFSRRHFATLLDQLSRDGAKVVGFDLNFPRPDEKSAVGAIRRIKAEYAEKVARGEADARYLVTLAEREREADTDRAFAEALQGAGNAVLGYYFYLSRREIGYVDPETQAEADDNLAFSAYSTQPARDEQGSSPPPVEEIFARSRLGVEGYLAESNLLRFTEAADFTVGYFNYFADRDGIFRHTLLTMLYKSAWREDGAEEAYFYPSLDIQVLRRYLDVPEHEMALIYNKAGLEAVQLGDLRIPTDPDGRMLIHYQGGPFTYSHISLADVEEGKFVPGTFSDKIVLVGPTALGINDFHPTPFAESFHAGVEIHANVLDTILNQRFIRRGGREQLIDLASILLLGLGMGGVLVSVRPQWTWPITAAVLAVFLLVAYMALAQFQVWLNLVVPGSVLVANFAGIVALRLGLEEREKRKTRAAFQQYVSPGLIQEVMKNPERLKLGGEERELTIMFSDIRGFTGLSERLSALELTGFLNAYTDEMTDIIFRHWGTLDKFEGDAIMCFWGAPYDQDDHMLRACNAALEMGRRMDELREQWRAEGRTDINIGLGLNTGRVVVGNMGSRKRFNYTVLGDPVNLASRLEGVNKTYSTRIIVSEFTYKKACDVLDILERRMSQQFQAPLEDLTSSNGSPRTTRLRSLLLYLASSQQLAPPGVLAERYGVDGSETLQHAVAEVEEWLPRDKKIRAFVEDAQRSLHPFCFRALDWIRVKGRREPVGIYELLGHGGDDNRYERLEVLFSTGLQAYRSQLWDAALETFEFILQEFPGDGPSQLFAERCRQYQSIPPNEDWDGVYVMKTK